MIPANACSGLLTACEAAFRQCPRPESNQRTRFRKPLDWFTSSTSTSVESAPSAFERARSTPEYG